MNDDLIPAVFRVSVLSLVQVSVFIVLYEAIVEMYVLFVGPMTKIFGFGMQVDYGVLLLSVLAGSNSVAQTFARRGLVRFGAVVAAGTAWAFYWSNIAGVAPNRFLLLSGLGIVSLLTCVLLTAASPEVREALKGNDRTIELR